METKTAAKPAAHAENDTAAKPAASAKKRKPINKDGKALTFVLLMLVYPVAHWLIFYLYANLNSIMLAFQYYNTATATFKFLPASRLFENFFSLFRDMFGSSNVDLFSYFKRGAMLHLSGLLISFPTGIVFAYLIYKKTPFSEVYKVVLYLPVILSGMVIAILFKYIIERGIPAIIDPEGLKNFPSLLTNQKYAFATILFYGVWMGMPGNIVINISTMSRIPEDLCEYGKLEGITMFQEFRMLVIPLIYPVLQIQLLGMFVGFFTAQGALYPIYAENATENLITFGYYMFTRIIGRNATYAMYPYTAASNLLIGLISVPIVYLTKWVMEKFDPQAEF